MSDPETAAELDALDHAECGADVHHVSASVMKELQRRYALEHRRDAWLDEKRSERSVSHFRDDDGQHAVQLFDESLPDHTAITRLSGELFGVRAGADYWTALERALDAVGA